MEQGWSESQRFPARICLEQALLEGCVAGGRPGPGVATELWRQAAGSRGHRLHCREPGATTAFPQARTSPASLRCSSHP